MAGPCNVLGLTLPRRLPFTPFNHVPTVTRGSARGGQQRFAVLRMLRLSISIIALLFGATDAGCGDAGGAKPGNYCALSAATQSLDTETICPVGNFCMGGFARSLPCPPLVADQCTVEGLSALPDLNAAV